MRAAPQLAAFRFEMGTTYGSDLSLLPQAADTGGARPEAMAASRPSPQVSLPIAGCAFYFGTIGALRLCVFLRAVFPATRFLPKR